MKYIMLAGSRWQQYFAINESDCKLSMIELRWTADGILDGILLDKYSTELGNYDAFVNKNLIATGEHINASAWNKIKKQAASYLSQMES